MQLRRVYPYEVNMTRKIPQASSESVISLSIMMHDVPQVLFAAMLPHLLLCEWVCCVGIGFFEGSYPALRMCAVMFMSLACFFL